MPIQSQYSIGMTIFTIPWSKDGGSDETHRINSVVAVAKARQLEGSGYRVRITDRGAANSRRANLANYFIKPRGF
jgi:hypothetical protein